MQYRSRRSRVPASNEELAASVIHELEAGYTDEASRSACWRRPGLQHNNMLQSSLYNAVPIFSLVLALEHAVLNTM